MPFNNGTFSKLYDWIGNKTDIPRKRGDSLNQEFENFSDGLTDLKTEIDTLATGDLTDWPASVSTTEVGYLDGVTSAIQTQLNAKASLSGATFTGSISTASVDLNAIYETKSVNAVDVFVYDTSRDSDGGAWRKRCQHTSWYNEELNTATRGARREFPAVAVIVAESNKVTIYDGDDPALPMWHVEDYTGLTIRAISALDGNLVIGCATGMIVSRYAADDLGTTTLDYTTTTTPAIVNNSVNDVAATVLPDAPIDPATGLPVPTIAVATAGGVSVITDSGAVYDSAKTTGATEAAIDGGRLRIAFTDSDVLAYDLASISADGFSGDIYDPATTPALLGTTTTLAKAASGSSSGLTLLEEDEATPANGMIARVTSSYNSGYQNGDIKGAFLADTDDTDLVGGENLVPNGDFSSPDISAWSSINAALSVVDGALRVTKSAINGQARLAVIATVPGRAYRYSATLIGRTTTSSVFLNMGTSSGGSQYISKTVVSGGNPVTAPITVSGSFVASSDQLHVSLYGALEAGQYDDWDNIVVEAADADRSVNNNGLIVNGTITRSPVADGAELVGYSGFSAANYLEQPYNSALDFGTGDFCVMGWATNPNVGQHTLISRIIDDDAGFTFQINSASRLQLVLREGASLSDISSAASFVGQFSGFRFLVGLRRAGVCEVWADGKLLLSAPSTRNITPSGLAGLRVGLNSDGASPADGMALWRISSTAPTPDQIAKIYEDERKLFQPGAQCTLYGASDAVTALAHDPVTDLLHVGTSAGRSVFQGLRRVDNTTDAVTTAISASNGLVVDQ